MLVGTIRPIQTQVFDVEGNSLDDIAVQVAAKTPVGWECLSMPVKMVKGSTALTATATIARRDEVHAIEADDMPTLRARVPDGYQLLHVRRA